MHHGWIGFLVASCIIFGSGYPSYGADARAVWSAKQGSGFDLFTSALVDGTWEAPNRIVSEKEDDITPVVTEDHDGIVWLVWIAVDASENSQPRYRAIQAGTIIRDGKIPSPFTLNYSPSVLVDSRNTVWASWSSSDGSNEEIYVSRFAGKKWLPPTRVSDGDGRPNITPLLTLGEDGTVRVSWAKLEKDGYHQYQKSWQGNTFAKKTRLREGLASAIADKKLSSSLPALPETAKSNPMTTIYKKSNDGIQAAPAWIPSLMPEVQP